MENELVVHNVKVLEYELEDDKDNNNSTDIELNNITNKNKENEK